MAEEQGDQLPQDGAGEEREPSFLAPFANAENRALDAQIRSLEKQLQQIDLTLEENAGRIGVMDEHLKNVQQEITYTESRVEAEKREVETEQHLKIMADKEIARVRGDLGRLECEKLQLADRITRLQASIFRGSERLDQFKLLMNWNQEELDQWAVAQCQKEEDNSALDKYRRQDEGKMKELGLAVEKLTQQVAVQRDVLDSEITDTQAAQIQLDRAAQDFRQLHAERQELIRQWDEAREAMKHRDEAIQVMTGAFAERKVLLKQKQAELDAQACFLAGEVANNRELEAQIAYHEREMGKARELQATEAAKLEDLTNQVELLQSILSKAANDLADAGTSNNAARQELNSKRQRLEAVRKKHAALKQQLEGEFGQLDSLEAKVSQLEGLHKCEEAALRALQQEHEALKKEQFRAGQGLHALRAREQELVAEIAGGQSQSKNLSARLKALDEQLLRQGELMYAVDLNLQEMERCIARAGGHRSDDEARALNARIAKLTEILEGVNAEHAMLLEQVKQAELDLGDARRANSTLGCENQRLDEAIEQLQLETDSTARTLKGAIADKERQLVDHDVLKLQVHRLRQLLSMHADEVYSLESRKEQLKLSLDERRHEIEVHRDGLKAELKLVREDVHRLTLEVRDRQQKVEVLATKFDTLTSKNRASDADCGEPKSQAYYIIKAAQEREQLQVAGDALDAKITKAEAEVAMLNNTLGQMQATNVAFSSSLRQADTKATLQERNALREQLDASYDRLKALRQQEAVLQAELQQQQAAGSSSEAELAGMQAIVDGLARKKAEADRQLEEQREKEARAMHAVQRAQKLLATQGSMVRGSSAASAEGGSSRGSSAAGSSRASSTAAAVSAAAAGDADAALKVEELQQDVQLAEARLVTRTMLQELKALMQQHPDADIAEAVEAAGFKLPTSSNTSSRANSRAASLAGSRAASRAGSIKSQPPAANLDAGSVASRSKGLQQQPQQQQQQPNRPSSSSRRIAAVKTFGN